MDVNVQGFLDEDVHDDADKDVMYVDALALTYMIHDVLVRDVLYVLCHKVVRS